MLELLAGVFGLIGSGLLAIPALSGLGDRKDLDNVRTVYEQDKAAALRINDATARDAALETAWDTYVASRDGILADAVGQFAPNRRWNVLGLLCLAAAFLLLILAGATNMWSQSAA